MAASLEIFHSFRQYIADGTIDLDTDTIKLALVTSSYTKNLAHTIWGDISTNEVTTGSGYSTGGTALANSDVTYSTTTAKWDADDVTFSSLTKTFRFGVLYKVGTANSVVNPLIGIILFDTTPADIAVSGSDYTVTWNVGGIYSWT
jgi:hypothetical protein